MPPRKGSRLFIDANVLIAASHSPAGGSSALLKLCEKGFFVAATTALVLQESEFNIRTKLDKKSLLRFYKLISKVPLLLLPAVSPEEKAKYHAVVHPKDAHVLSAAILARCDYLITLDQKHFMNDRVHRARLPLNISTPGDFLKQLKDA